MLDVQLSSSDWLEGWTPGQAASSGLIPNGMLVEDDLHNVFRFETIWEYITSDHFSITTPAMDIDGSAIDKKTILFKRVEKKVLHDALCS